MATSTRTAIGTIGEEGLIARIQEWVPLAEAASAVRKGIGDDAAVYAPAKGLCQVVSTDMLVEGTHFDLSYMPLMHLGYKVVAVSVSDLVAMMAQPRYFLCAIGLSRRFSVEDAEALYKGMGAACAAYDMHLIGGDTIASPSGLLLNGTALGEGAESELVYRSGAQEGDVLCVSGDLGSAYIGLEVLRNKQKVFVAQPDSPPDLRPYRYLVGRQIKPEARADIVSLFRAHNVRPHAMMDLSDGLSVSVKQLCEAAHVGAIIHAEDVPIHTIAQQTALELDLDPMVCALNGGEDYELLWTMNETAFDSIAHSPDVHRIGRIQAKTKGISLLKGSEIQPLRVKSWQHFSSKDDRTGV